MSESAIVKEVYAFLKDAEARGQCYFIRNNTGTLRAGRRRVRFGKKGSPDFIIALAGGVTLWVEVKTSRTSQSEAQQASADELKNLNHKYLVVRSLDELLEAIAIFQQQGMDTD